jgi:hypothetical protein
MWIHILTQICISFILVFLLHSIYQYIKNTYTTKKTKDLVGFQVQKYQDILKELQNSSTIKKSPVYLSDQDKARMNAELDNLVINDL